MQYLGYLPCIYTESLPRICRKKGCLAVATEPGYFCSAHKKLAKKAVPRNGTSKALKNPFSNRWIYFIQENDGPVKIGKASDVWARFSAISVGSSKEYRLLAFIEAPQTLETKLHEYFNESHIRGEWFKDSPILEYVIQACKENNLSSICELIGYKLVTHEIPKAWASYCRK